MCEPDIDTGNCTFVERLHRDPTLVVMGCYKEQKQFCKLFKKTFDISNM